MTTLERLKIELNNRDYFTDEKYSIFLEENNLTATGEYNKATMQRNLLITIVDILEAVSNDIDLMRKVSDDTTGFSTSEAYKMIRERISDIKTRIAAIPTGQENNYSNVSLLFTKSRR